MGGLIIVIIGFVVLFFAMDIFVGFIYESGSIILSIISSSFFWIVVIVVAILILVIHFLSD